MSHSGKNLIKRILGSRIFLFLISLALIGLIISVGRETYHKHQLSKEIKRLEAEIKQLEGRNQYLSNLKEYFNDDSFLEEQARLKMNLKKPGESVVVIEHSEESSEQETEEKIELISEEELPNYWEWWKYFFGE